MSEREISINVPVLARVEGEGALHLDIRGDSIEALQLRIFEPPRLFEKLLEGRRYDEVPDMVARICGICPVAYQMSAVQALESIFGAEITPWIRDMRRLLYCGEWIESHSLHIHLLALPDFMGCNSVIELAEKDAQLVQRGLRLQEAGNAIIRLLGGRSVHPVGVCVGGFYKAPGHAEIQQLRQQLASCLDDAESLLRWTLDLPVPEFLQATEWVALRQPGEYPFNEGRLVSNRGLDIDKADFLGEFAELHVPHSTALHCLHRGQPYLVGPLARVKLNFSSLTSRVQSILLGSTIDWHDTTHCNMYHSMIARAAEILYALEEAVRLLDAYTFPAAPSVEVTPRSGVGYGCTEAPRGLLWHRYETDAAGNILQAQIVPPTSQNQAHMELDLRLSLQAMGLNQQTSDLRARAEQIIRNYDPCISCATHFLDLTLART